MVQQSPKGTPNSRRTPTRTAPNCKKQVWTTCPNCGFKTTVGHDCGVVGPCIGESMIKLTSVYKDSAYAHIHPDTMKEIGIQIGGFLRINSDVLEVWADTSILLSHVAFATQERGLATVELIPMIRSAADITVELEGKVDKAYLPFVLQNKVVYVGQVISIPFFSNTVSIKVISAAPIVNPDERKLPPEKGIEALALKLSKTGIVEWFYKILPSTTFTEQLQVPELPKIVGADEVKEKIIHILNRCLSSSDCFGAMGPPRSLVISGPTGCGKTLVCKTVLQLVEYQSCCVQDFSKHISCQDNTRIVLLDALDTVREDDFVKIERISTFLSCLPGNVFVLATCSSLPSPLKKFFPLQLEMPPVTSDTRFELFESYIKNVKCNKNEISTGDIMTVASKAHGYVGADICNVCRQALLLAEDGNLNLGHLLTALTNVPPRSMNDIKVEVPEVRWSDIGGLQEVQSLLTKIITWPMLYQEKYRSMGIVPAKGLLMYGPPGCCKTMMAKALATESGLNFLSVRGPELLSMYVGESERAIRDLFSRARTASPAIIFFDEIDALATHRGEGKGSGVQDRVLAQLLTELDGVEGLTGVVVIAATNRPDRLDKALLRPGRLEKLVYIPLPDYAARLEIFKLKFSKIPHEEDVCFDKCAELSAGFSGAEVVSVCHNVAIEAIGLGATVTRVMVEAAIKDTIPQTSTQSLEFYDSFRFNKL